jgi:hypothetical protein
MLIRCGTILIAAATLVASMSRLDELPADQRSVLQLLLKQGKGYADLSGLLNVHANEVRSRAYDALDAIGPGAAGLPSDRRQAIADWLLGQQAPDEASETRAFVSGSPAGRAWASAVADQLRPLGGDRLPEVPADGAGGAALAPQNRAAADAARDAAAEPGSETGAAAAPSPPDGATAGAANANAAPPPAGTVPFAPAPTAAPRVSRRGGAILIGVVLAAIVAVVLVLVLTGGDDNKPERAANTAPTTTSTQPVVKAQVNLVPPKGAPASKALAIVQIVDSNGQNVVNAVSQGLPTTSKAAFAIWAYTSPSETRLIGGFNKTDNKGHLVYQGALPQDVTDITRYKEILVTRETSGNPTKPGQIYLRGPMQAGSTSGG